MAEQTRTTPAPDLPRVVGFLGASGVMVGVMIGSGIFRTPPDIAKHLGSPALILGAWVVGGLLSLFGAFSYAELATMYPRSGGIYVFLRQAYGESMAFTFGWTYMLLSKPLAAAGIAIIFAEHVNRLLGTSIDPRVLTSAVLIVLTCVNIWGVRQSTGLGIVLTILKSLALAAIIAVGVCAMAGWVRLHPVAQPEGVALAPRSLWLAAAPVMASVLWTYDGWSDVGAIAGEVENPGRLLPRVFVVNTIGVTLLYVGVNVVYLAFIPPDRMRSMETVAPHVMELMLGPGGAVAVTLIIIISTLGSTHASIMTGARVSFAQARDGLLFAFLGRMHPTFRTPHASLLIQLVLSLAATWLLGAFESLAGGFVFTMWIFYGLAGLALFVLRAKNPGAERVYRCPGYPVVPAIFVLVAFAMTVLAIISDPVHTLVWVGVLLLGWPVFRIWDRSFRPRGARMVG